MSLSSSKVGVRVPPGPRRPWFGREAAGGLRTGRLPLKVTLTESSTFLIMEMQLDRFMTPNCKTVRGFAFGSKASAWLLQSGPASFLSPTLPAFQTAEARFFFRRRRREWAGTSARPSRLTPGRRRAEPDPADHV